MHHHKVIPAPWLLILATVMLAQPLCLLFLVRIIHATGKPLVIPNWKYSLQWWRTVAWRRHPHKTGRGGYDYRVYRRNQKARKNKMENSMPLKRLQKWRNCGERKVFFTFLWMSSRTCLVVLNNRSSQCRIELPEWEKALEPLYDTALVMPRLLTRRLPQNFLWSCTPWSLALPYLPDLPGLAFNLVNLC